MIKAPAVYKQKGLGGVLTKGQGSEVFTAYSDLYIVSLLLQQPKPNKLNIESRSPARESKSLKFFRELCKYYLTP